MKQIEITLRYEVCKYVNGAWFELINRVHVYGCVHPCVCVCVCVCVCGVDQIYSVEILTGRLCPCV